MQYSIRLTIAKIPRSLIAPAEREEMARLDRDLAALKRIFTPPAARR